MLACVGDTEKYNIVPVLQYHLHTGETDKQEYTKNTRAEQGREEGDTKKESLLRKALFRKLRTWKAG